MTYEFYRELEDRIIDAMHRHKRLEVDLSEVSEIDLCGIHLIGLLKNVGAIVAVSPVVEQASKGLLVSFNAAALGRSERAVCAGVSVGGASPTAADLSSGKP